MTHMESIDGTKAANQQIDIAESLLQNSFEGEPLFADNTDHDQGNTLAAMQFPLAEIASALAAIARVQIAEYYRKYGVEVAAERKK